MRRWQFSIRGLLIVTAFVSLVLAIAVRLPILFTVCLSVTAPTLLMIAVLQSANFATSERRPRLALIAWIMLAAFFALYSFAILRASVLGENGVSGFAIFGLAIMSLCLITCLSKAWQSYRLSRRSPTAVDSVSNDPSESLPRIDADL
jgi:hypothetical protein